MKNTYQDQEETMNKIEYNYKKLIVFFYFIIPFVFYLVPYLLSLEYGGLSFHFFKTFFVTKNELFVLFIGHVMLGSGIIWMLSSVKYTIIFRESKSFSSDICAIVLFVIYFYVPISYVTIFAFPLFVLCISRSMPYNITFVILLFIACMQLIFNYDRYPVIMVLIIWSVKLLSGFNYNKLFFGSILAIVFLIYVLQPLRAGIIPFANQGALDSLSYFFIHLNPIYICAYLSYSLDFSVWVLLSESIPLMKSIIGSDGVIEIIANYGLPDDIIADGIRYGSNSSMYFSPLGTIILLLGGGLIRYSLKYIKLTVFKNAVMLNFILQGPYFIRRSFGSMIIDFIVMLFVAFLFFLFIRTYNKSR